MVQKHFGQRLISAQIIGSSVNFLSAVTAERAALLQRADRHVSPRAAAPRKSENYVCACCVFRGFNSQATAFIIRILNYCFLCNNHVTSGF